MVLRLKNLRLCFLAILLLSGFLCAKDTPSCAEGTLISAISFEGLEHTKSRVVERELLNRVGEPFSAEKFEAEKRRLQDLDLFTEITVSCSANLNSSDSPREDSLSSFVSRL